MRENRTYGLMRGRGQAIACLPLYSTEKTSWHFVVKIRAWRRRVGAEHGMPTARARGHPKGELECPALRMGRATTAKGKGRTQKTENRLPKMGRRKPAAENGGRKWCRAPRNRLKALGGRRWAFVYLGPSA